MVTTGNNEPFSGVSRGGGASSSGAKGEGGNGGEKRMMTRLQEKKPAHVRLDTETAPMEETLVGEEEVRVR